jgi:PRTRC genetic system ThiF family protein
MSDAIIELEHKLPAVIAASPTPALDLSYLEALPLVTYDYKQINVVMVGLGGTGSWLAPHAARITRMLLDRGKQARLIFIDHDIVEAANVERQNFCLAEVGYHKARVLALRYGLPWGLDIAVYNESFKYINYTVNQPKLDLYGWGKMTVFIGCVDNAAARKSLSNTIRNNPNNKELPKVFWLDCGNTKDNGQVLLGTVSGEDNTGALAYAFDLPGVCTNLPGPDMQDPSLLVARPEELAGASDSLSCEAMAAANAQSMMINQRVAAEAADYLLRLLVTGGLKKFQTFIDLPSGTSRSTYITPTGIERAISPEFIPRYIVAKDQKARKGE